MEQAVENHAILNKTQRCLIGAYFLHEYSFEASALLNPSIARHPISPGRPAAGLFEPPRCWRRSYFIATFRSGTIAADGSVAIDQPRVLRLPKVRSRTSGLT
jgi:hypothetical protein